MPQTIITQQLLRLYGYLPLGITSNSGIRTMDSSLCLCSTKCQFMAYITFITKLIRICIFGRIEGIFLVQLFVSYTMNKGTQT